MPKLEQSRLLFLAPELIEAITDDVSSSNRNDISIADHFAFEILS